LARRLRLNLGAAKRGEESCKVEEGKLAVNAKGGDATGRAPNIHN